MSDRADASIMIAGPLKRADIDRLAEAAEEDRAGDEYEPRDASEIRALILAADADGQPLRLSGREIPGANFPTLETLCRDLGLTYSRHSEAYLGGWDEGLAFWEPGMAPIEFDNNWACGAAGAPMLEAGQIRAALADGTLDTLLVEMDRIETFPFALSLAG